MGIETLYADGIEQAYRRGLTSPAPQADPDFRTFGFLASGLSGIPRAAMEVLSSVRDLSADADRQFRESPRGRIVAQEYERRTGVKPADQYRMPGGTSIRQAAEYNLAPDPQTSHMADQVFHGLTRFGTKAVGAVVTGGPVGGAALLGAEETNTIYRDLIGRGIDSETALKVAAVQGAISAAGVVLPVSGAGMAATTAGKVGATAGLVAAGGPGAYVAQETLARDILQRAGYADEAGKHDPADPLGLALSTILPAAFGAVSLRGALRTPKQIGPIKTEAGVRDAVQLTPEEQAASDAYERSAANLAELRAEIARTKDPAARQVLEAELAKQTEAAAQAGRGAVAESAARSPEVVDAARVKVLRETVQRSLPQEPEAYPRLMEAIDDVAAGRTPQAPDFITPEQRAANLAAFMEGSKATDRTGAPLVLYRGRVGAPEDNIRADVVYFTPDKQAAGEYAQTRVGEGFDGEPSVLSAYVRLLNPADEIDIRRVAMQNGIELPHIDYPAAYLDSTPELVAALKREGYDGAVGTDGVPTDGREIKSYAVFDRGAVKSTGNSGRFDPNSGSLTDPLDAAPPFRPDAAATPQAPNPEAAAPARGAGDDATPGVPEPGRTAADVQAAGRAVTPEQIALRKRAVMLNKLLECLNG